MTFSLPQLPIETILPALKRSLSNHPSVILSAEPGSGKTTIVPLALLHEPWLGQKKIILLAPRRIAARMAAKRLSELAGDTVGGVVGYRVRFETKVSARTRIEVMTEGVFTRMLQNDPELEGVGLVLFDEYHLRSIESDLALALCLDILELRTDLKLVVMSATIDSEKLSRLLDDAPVIHGEGRCYPVDIRYLARETTDHIVPLVVRTIYRALEENEGDILVFLPGAGEIKGVTKQLAGDFRLLPLYGNLPSHLQDQVFAPASQRKVILATPIAETSLTIEGISVVIDSGLMKKPLFSAASGLSSLRTVPISKASATQRSGRAGRLGPGRCYRLWTETTHYSKPDFLPPEIVSADLTPLLLELIQWGVKDPEELRWLDPPRKGQIAQAWSLLEQLGVIDGNGTLTAVGKKVARLPLHPRLGSMLLQGAARNQSMLGCRLAALLQNRDLFRGKSDERGADIEDRLDILNLYQATRHKAIAAKGADLSLCKQVMREASQYHKLLDPGPEKPYSTGDAGNLLAFAYPERIAQRKSSSSTFLLASGRGATLPAADHLQQSKLLVAANVDGGAKQGRIFLGAVIRLDDILEHHDTLLQEKEELTWDGKRVEAAKLLTLGKIAISKKPLSDPDPEQVRACLMAGLQQVGPAALPLSSACREWLKRLETAHALAPDTWPDFSTHGLLEDLSWLAPYLDGLTTLKQVEKLNFQEILQARLSWQEQQQLDTLLPTHFQAPSGSKIKLEYHGDAPPVLAVRLQEIFGVTETPLLYQGQLPLLVHLLSPARRPVQVTTDLASFWKNTYPEVKKELSGRYPKHYWPDDPLIAQPTARCKPR